MSTTLSPETLSQRLDRELRELGEAGLKFDRASARLKGAYTPSEEDAEEFRKARAEMESCHFLADRTLRELTGYGIAELTQKFVARPPRPRRGLRA